jgi:predicted ATP-dependent serine protease
VRIRPLATGPQRAPRGFSHIGSGLIERFAKLGQTITPTASSTSASPPPKARKLFDVETEPRRRYAIHHPILDRAFGPTDAPGIAERSTTILAGMPGTFKTTLALEMLASIAHHEGVGVTFLSAELAAPLVKEYATRCGIFRRFPRAKSLFEIVEVETIAEALGALDATVGEVAVLDSLQRACHKEQTPIVQAAIAFAKRCAKSPHKPSRAAVLIGHGTKDGDMSGTMAAMHEVDALFLLEFFDQLTGETLPPKHRKDVMRLCSAKNRFSDASGIVGAFRLDQRRGPLPLPL